MITGFRHLAMTMREIALPPTVALEGFVNFVIGGICPVYDRFSFVEIIPYPMGKGYNTSRLTYPDAYKLAFLIGLLPQSVNLYSTYNIRQWRYDYRLRLLWLMLRLCLSLRRRVSI